jgi:hypothetical protein
MAVENSQVQPALRYENFRKYVWQVLKQNKWEITSILTEQQRTCGEKAEAGDFHGTKKKLNRGECLWMALQ